MRTSITRALALALTVFSIASPAVRAVPQQHDRQDEIQEVIVTGSFVTQGGAKDVNYLRGEVEQARIPHPDTFTAEGLISEHSVVIESAAPCAQVFCLVADSIDANLIAQPEARYLIGLGFTTNVQSNGWRRKPLNLVAVVDKSGSMEGEPLALVRERIAEIESFGSTAMEAGLQLGYEVARQNSERGAGAGSSISPRSGPASAPARSVSPTAPPRPASKV